MGFNFLVGVCMQFVVSSWRSGIIQLAVWHHPKPADIHLRLPF